MDLDGVYGGVVYPIVGLLLFATVRDSQLLTAIFRTYNDFCAEFCGAYPDRLKGIAMINLDDIQEGIHELERARTLELAGAMITKYPPEDRSYDRPLYEPFWAAAQALEMPLGMH